MLDGPGTEAAWYVSDGLTDRPGSTGQLNL